MARRKHHEEHANHEAWAIPYGDLVTLLLAFFVVMYAISSLNEGKYRVLADSLSEAFGGPPRTIRPLQLGDVQPRGSEMDRSPPVIITSGARGPVAPIPLRSWENRPQVDRSPGDSLDAAVQTADRAAMVRAERQLAEISARVEQALVNLIDADLVKVRRTQLWLEVEINSDVLFASGVAEPQAAAVPALVSLANALQPFPNPIRVEGHTDDIPIRTLQFPSNWELSSARASSVVQLFDRQGITPDRLAVIGYGEHRPVADNATPSGRNANRRVVIVVLATPEGVDELEGPAGALEALDQGGRG